MAAFNYYSTSVVTEHGQVLQWARRLDPRLEDAPHDVEERFVMTAFSSNSMASLSTRGEVFVEGRNYCGMLGVGDPVGLLLRTRIPQTSFGGRMVHQIGMGTQHSIVLASGNVFTAGCGAFGRLGHGNAVSVAEFKRVEALANVTVGFVAAGLSSSSVIADGRVYTFGRNACGELGFVQSSCSLLPHCLPEYSDSPAVVVSMGKHSMAAVHENGELYAWGDNSLGQLGLGDGVSRDTPTLVSCKPVVTVSCGLDHMLALTKHGDVYCCGNHYDRSTDKAGYSQATSVLVRVEGMPAAVSVSAGRGQRFAAVTTEGRLYMWDVNSVPTMFPLRARVGLYNHAIATEHVLAFAMLLHRRLGHESRLSALPEELVRRVLDKTKSWPAGPVGTLEGVARLLGGAAVTRAP